MPSIYIFIDESGNFDFSPKGTKHFVLSAITALNPLISSRKLQSLKYKMLASDINIDFFHAAPDKQAVRDAVFDEIARMSNIKINYIYAVKQKTHPKYQSPEALYALFGKTLLKYVLRGQLASRYEQVIIVFDSALTKKQQNAFSNVVKLELKPLNKPYKIYFHPTVADFNAQIADYCAWARYVALERNEPRPLKVINKIPISDFDIFKRGDKTYY